MKSILISTIILVLSFISVETNAATCPSQQLTLPIYYSTPASHYLCVATMPASVSKTGVWSSVDDDGTNKTGAGCIYGNVVGAHFGTLVTLGAKPSICRNYCSLIADCNADGQWVNVKYTW
jgi:hypothetical protein